MFLKTVLFFTFLAAIAIQFYYYLNYFLKLALYKKPSTIKHTPPVSVIICARNEEKNLTNFLSLVLEQDYPKFEVVVVNDCSYDNTEDILKEFSKKYAHLKIVTIKESENHEHGKKIAVMMGIKGATHEHLLFTDADCKPNSNKWIQNMTEHFVAPETEIVLGYGGYNKELSFINKIIRFDTFFIALQYLSFALAGKTYMGVGRNLAYKKSLFFKMKGFASHYHIPSGDDDLFVNEAANKHNSKIEIDINSQTVSNPKKTLGSWIVQKRRHIITFKHYNIKSKIHLSLIAASNYAVYFLFFILLILGVNTQLIISLFIVRLLIQISIFIKPMRFFGEKDLIFIFPVIEFLLLFLYPYIGISNYIIRKVNWR